MTWTVEQRSRRSVLKGAGALLVTAGITSGRSLLAQELAALEVASAGAARAMLEGPLKNNAAVSLKLDLHEHAGGADAVARTLVDGSLRADVFLPITASPMQIAMKAGKITVAYPVARTELVLLYSPKSKFIAQFEAAGKGETTWWQVLQQPGIRIARSNPALDPSGRAIYFMMMLAARKYKQPDLVEKILGSPLNPAQVLGGSAQAMLASGEIDAMCVYKTGPANSGQSYLSLPAEINLSQTNVRAEHPDLKLTVNDRTFYPEPLIFYVGALKDAPNAAGAAAFVHWLQDVEAQSLFRQNHFDLPGDAKPVYA